MPCRLLHNIWWQCCATRGLRALFFRAVRLRSRKHRVHVVSRRIYCGKFGRGVVHRLRSGQGRKFKSCGRIRLLHRVQPGEILISRVPKFVKTALRAGTRILELRPRASGAPKGGSRTSQGSQAVAHAKAERFKTYRPAPTARTAPMAGLRAAQEASPHARSVRPESLRPSP